MTNGNFASDFDDKFTKYTKYCIMDKQVKNYGQESR